MSWGAFNLKDDAAIAAVAGLIVFVGMIVHYYWNRRHAESWRLVAARLGFDYSPTADAFALAAITALEMFPDGRKPRTRNAISHIRGDTEVALFEYQFEYEGKQFPDVAKQTVMVFGSERLQLPTFRLRPKFEREERMERLGERDASASLPDGVAKLYRLVTANPKPFTIALSPAAEQLLSTDGRWTIVGDNRLLAVYRPRRVVAPEEAPDFLESAYRLFAALSAPKT